MSSEGAKPVNVDERKPLPRWLVVPLIVASAAVTVAAMSMTGLRGPAVAWERANHGIEQAWFGEQSPPQPTPPGDAILPVAGSPAVPTIVAGAVMTHADRGVCTACHAIVSLQGTPVPAINSLSSMPHAFRGVCSNCHVARPARTAFASPVAGTPVSPPPAAPPAAAVTEGEWQGLEVSAGPTGVVIRSAEGSAGLVGIRAGDVVTSINALPVQSVADFVRITQGGALAQAALIVRRGGQRLAFELGGMQNPAPPAPNTNWGTSPVVLPAPNAQL
jgi:hypothetical protein